jgi:hypothetical protein
MGDGTVKYAGYKNEGRVLFKGMRNKRRQIKAAENRLANLKESRLQQRKQVREDEWQNEWGDNNHNKSAKR